MKIWVDGSGWNGKRARYAVVFEDGRKFEKTILVKRTSNQMEYWALLKALHEAKAGDTIYTDSRLVINQVKGRWGVASAGLLNLHDHAFKLFKKKGVHLQWIPREENRAGFLLEKTKRNNRG